MFIVVVIKVYSGSMFIIERFFRSAFVIYLLNRRRFSLLHKAVFTRPNTFKMADGCGEEASAEKNQNWGYYEAKCLVETWADEEIQRQLSAMGRK